MIHDGKYSETEVALISDHADEIIGTMEDNIARLKALPQGIESPYLAGQVMYWRHVIAAMRLSKSIASSKLRK